MSKPVVPLVSPPGSGDLVGVFAEVAAARGGTVANVFRALAHNPATLLATASLGAHARFGTSLRAVDRELVILTVARATGCTYEWTHHLEALAAWGMSADDVVRMLSGPGDDVTASALAVAHFIGMGRDVPPDVCARLRDLAGPAVLVDTIVTAGYYVLLARVIQSLDVPLEDHVTPLPIPPLEESA